MLVLGGGPGGYSAAFRAADLGQRVVLVLDRPLEAGDGLPAGVSLLAAFTGAITDENFHLYQVD